MIANDFEGRLRQVLPDQWETIAPLADQIRKAFVSEEFDVPDLPNSNFETFRTGTDSPIPKQRTHWRNIVYSWSTLYKAIPNMVLAGSAVTASPYLIPVAALVIYNEANSQAQKTVTIDQGIVVHALFEAGRPCTAEEILKAIDNLPYKPPTAITERSIEKVIDDLLAMKAVSMRDGKVRLIEKVVVKRRLS